jgi:beta-N-acetylglucosaminidase
MRKSLNLFICGLLLMAFAIMPITTVTTAEAATYTKASDLETELKAMAEAGIVLGSANGDLRPKDNVTRGEFAVFIARALKLPAGPSNVFTDVSGALASGINSAYAAKLVSGYSKTTFAPDKNITRQEASAIIARALTNFKNVTSKQPPTAFSDAAKISPLFKEAVNLNAEYGIIKGVSNGDGTYRFLPGDLATREAAAAFISRMLKVPNGVPIEVDPSKYTISTIDNGLIKPTSQAFTSFETAKAEVKTSNQVILNNNKVVYMTNGIVRPNKTITLYISSDFSRSDQNFSYAGNQEMKYLDATAEFVKVQVADTIAYAKASELTLVPLQLIKGRNYYTVNDAGELIHYIYSPANIKYEPPYTVGKAPSFLQKGVKYYSWNGIDFTTTTGVKVGSAAYQYFNYLAARSTTSYNAAELNNYITQKLVEVEALYKNNPSGYPQFKDATKRSKIIGLGTAVKEAESKHGINALIILSIAMHESWFGMSPTALEKNNLFGLNAIDGTNDALSFANVGESIDELANGYWNKNYIEPGSPYFHGAILGNKSTGFNVKYAADPYWGQKIAGHMYKVDKALGGKDFGKYRIAVTKVTSVNVRESAGINPGTIKYQYADIGVPITIKKSINHTDGYEWNEVVSDSKALPTGYIRADGLTELLIVK